MSSELELYRAVGEETLDPEYVTRTHGLIGTYMHGCRGPLCRKANRDYRREQYAKRSGGTNRINSPRSERANDDLLTLLQVQHMTQRSQQTECAS